MSSEAARTRRQREKAAFSSRECSSVGGDGTRISLFFVAPSTSFRRPSLTPFLLSFLSISLSLSPPPPLPPPSQKKGLHPEPHSGPHLGGRRPGRRRPLRLRRHRAHRGLRRRQALLERRPRPRGLVARRHGPAARRVRRAAQRRPLDDARRRRRALGRAPGSRDRPRAGRRRVALFDERRRADVYSGGDAGRGDDGRLVGRAEGAPSQPGVDLVQVEEARVSRQGSRGRSGGEVVRL